MNQTPADKMSDEELAKGLIEIWVDPEAPRQKRSDDYAVINASARRLRARSQLLDALATIKARIQADEDFSADEIIEFINGMVGKFSMTKAWVMAAAEREQPVPPDERATACAREIERKIDDVGHVTLDEFAAIIARHREAEFQCPSAHNLAEVFLRWPLPESVCADRVTTMHGEKHRVGTNLLSYIEAKQMFEYVLAKAKTAALATPREKEGA